MPGAPPTYRGSPYDPLDACIALWDSWTDGDDLHTVHQFATGMRRTDPAGGGQQLSDQAIFDRMALLFDTSGEGRAYIESYQGFGTEMGKIGLDDASLLWDAHGALQDFLPGLEALVSGTVDQVLVAQEMADDALDIWQRIATVGSPGLAAAIDGELAKYDDLQAFVGLSFDAWAEAIGIAPLTEKIYLPLVKLSP